MTVTTVVLASLAGRIAVEHAACTSATRTALAHARACGVLLAEAKAALPHGAWTGWLAVHFPGSPRTAQAYMRVAARWPELDAKAQSSAGLNLDGALRLLAVPVGDAVERLLALYARVEWPGTSPAAVAYAPTFDLLIAERAECAGAATAALVERGDRADRMAASGALADAVREWQAVAADVGRVLGAAVAFQVRAQRVCGLLDASVPA